MNIIYKITYLPHLINNTPPFYYVGSKHNYNKSYFGSPSSSQKDWYTETMSISDWWKYKVKHSNSDFIFEILSDCGDISPLCLVEIEKKLHLEMDVKNSAEYFNKSIATTGWVSIPRTEESKKHISEKTKLYWNSEEGKLKKERLAARNKITKSEELKNRWKTDEEFRKSASVVGRKRTDEMKIKDKEGKLKEVEYKGTFYRGWEDLTTNTGVTPFLYKKYYKNGYDPEVNIGIRHHPKYIKLDKEIYNDKNMFNN